MRFAYADPPYPGKARRWYRDHPDYGGEVDHAELIGQLCRDYPDGWALSTSANALQTILTLCPPGVRAAIWHRTDSQPPGRNPTRWQQVWEPVIIRGGRHHRDDGPVVRNLLTAGSLSGGCSGHEGHSIPGQKPAVFCRWVFALLGAHPDDELHDLFPGSGAVIREWAAYRVQPMLALAEPRRTHTHTDRRPREMERAGAKPLWEAVP